MFSIIVIAHVKDGADKDWAYLRYELSKEKWSALGNPETLFMRLPEDEIILMR
jgi:hypothetical protein